MEHVFGAQSNDMGGTLVRSIGLTLAKARISLKNLTYNMRRFVQLERYAAEACGGTNGHFERAHFRAINQASPYLSAMSVSISSNSLG